MKQIPKRVLQSAAAIVGILLTVSLLGMWALHTDLVRRYLLSLAIQRIEAATGGRVEIRNVQFGIFHPSADFYDLRIHGTETDPSRPFMAVDRLSIDFGLALLDAQKFSIRNVVAVHPIIRVGFTEAGSTLPHPRATGGSGNLFDLGIRHLTIDRGEVHINDRTTPLTADVEDVRLRATFDDRAATYDGMLRYRGAVIRYGDSSALSHDLDASFAAGRGGITIKSLALRSGDSWLAAQGQLRDYVNQVIELSYRASIASKDIAPFWNGPLSVSGTVNASGFAAYRNVPDKTALSTLQLSGKFDSAELRLSRDTIKSSIRRLQGAFDFRDGNLEIAGIQADALGGHLQGELHLAQLSGRSSGRFQGQIRQVSLRSVRDLLAPKASPEVLVTGTSNVGVQASWVGGINQAQLQADVTLMGVLGSSRNMDRTARGSGAIGGSPIEGHLVFAYDARTDSLVLRNSHMATDSNRLTLEGRLGRHSNLNIQARLDDLSELSLLARAFQSAPASRADSTRQYDALYDLDGTAGFTGTVSGTVAEPRVSGTLTANRVHVRTATVEFIKTGIQLSSSAIALGSGELRTETNGTASFEANIALTNWKFDKNNPLRLRTRVNRLLLSDLQSVTGIQVPVTGVLSGRATFQGSWNTPRGEGSVQLTNAVAWEEPIRSVAIQFEGTGMDVRGNFRADTPSGPVNGVLTYAPRERAYEIQLNAPTLQLAKIHYTSQRRMSGVLSLTANGSGTIANPQLSAELKVSSLQVGDEKIGDVRSVAAIAHQQAHVILDATISGAPLNVDAMVNLIGDYQTTATVNSRTIELGGILAAWMPADEGAFRGQAQLHGSLKGPLKTPRSIEAQFEIPTFNLSYQDVQIAAESPIVVRYQKGIATLDQATLKGTGTNIELHARADLFEKKMIAGVAEGQIDLKLMRLANSGWQSTGQAALKLSASGSTVDPNISGTIRLIDASFTGDPQMPSLEHANGEVSLAGRRIQVKTFRGRLGGGNIEVYGSATYSPLQFGLSATMRNVRVLYPDGVRTVFGGNLSLTGSSDAAGLSGQLNVNRISFSKSFDLASLTSTISGSTTPSSGLAQKIRLNVAVLSRQELELSTGQLAVQGSADMRIQGTMAEPVLLGRTTLTGGEVFYSGKRFQIQNGVIQFVNPTRTEGVVNLTASVTIQQFDVNLNLNGPIDHPRVNYTADPYLAPVDIINLLITGRTVEAAQVNPSTPQSVVASQISGQVSNQLQKLTGLSSLTIDPQIGGHGNPGSQLAIQQRVTKNLFFTFATDVTKTQGQTVQVEYQATRRYSVSAIRDQTGGYEVEVKSHKTF